MQDTATIERLQTENERLRQHIAELEQTLTTTRNDVQILRDAEEELHQKIQLLQALFNAIPNPVFYKDREGYYRDCNDLFASQIFGLPKQEIVGRTLQQLANLLPPDLKQIYQKQDEKLIFEPGIQVYESQVRCADSTRHDFLFSKTTFMNKADEVAGIVGVMTDITQHKQLEHELRAFYTLSENAPDGIAIASISGTLTYANNAFRTLYGYEDATIGMSIADFFADTEKHVAADMIQHVLQEGIWQHMNSYQHKAGHTIPVQVSVFLIRDEQGNPLSLASLHQDMTEHVEREEAMRRSQELIIETQQQAIQQLGTPLLPLANGIVAMPLIGTIDTTRAMHIMETLLEGVATQRANVAILDITGVQTVDEQVANALVQTAQAVRLLGAEVILSGIGPAMAQTLVAMGADLSSVATRSTLQESIAYAMRH